MHQLRPRFLDGLMRAFLSADAPQQCNGVLVLLEFLTVLPEEVQRLDLSVDKRYWSSVYMRQSAHR